MSGTIVAGVDGSQCSDAAVTRERSSWLPGSATRSSSCTRSSRRFAASATSGRSQQALQELGAPIVEQAVARAREAGVTAESALDPKRPAEALLEVAIEALGAPHRCGHWRVSARSPASFSARCHTSSSTGRASPCSSSQFGRRLTRYAQKVIGNSSHCEEMRPSRSATRSLPRGPVSRPRELDEVDRGHHRGAAAQRARAIPAHRRRARRLRGDGTCALRAPRRRRHPPGHGRHEPARPGLRRPGDGRSAYGRRSRARCGGDRPLGRGRLRRHHRRPVRRARRARLCGPSAPARADEPHPRA